MLDILNIYNFICSLSLNKGGKIKEKMECCVPNGILEQKTQINEQIGKMQMQSGV